jgi:hypothetical protein
MTTAPSPAPVPAEPAEVCFRADLSDVLADYGWNARSKTDLARVVSDDLAGYNPELEGTGMGGFRGTKTEPGLVELIVNQGQRDPCDVRPNPAHAKNPKAPKYEVTAGFRRHYALHLIAQNGLKHQDFFPIKGDPTWDARKPTILVLLKQQTNREARERNLVENVGRSNLSTPDLAHGVADLWRLLAEESRGREPTNDDVARRIGKSPPYVGNLIRIMRLPDSITKHWREGGEAIIAGQRVICAGSLPFGRMCDLVGMQPGTDYETEYVKMVMGSRDNTTGERKELAERKFANAMDHAAELGELVAFLGHEGIDPAHVQPLEWGKIVQELVDYEGATAEQLDLLARRLSTSYDSERKSLSDPEDGEGDIDGNGNEEAVERRRQGRDHGR